MALLPPEVRRLQHAVGLHLEAGTPASLVAGRFPDTAASIQALVGDPNPASTKRGVLVQAIAASALERIGETALAAQYRTAAAQGVK